MALLKICLQTSQFIVKLRQRVQRERGFAVSEEDVLLFWEDLQPLIKIKSRWTVTKMERDGRFPHRVEVGGRVAWKLSEVRLWLRNLPRADLSINRQDPWLMASKERAVEARLRNQRQPAVRGRQRRAKAARAAAAAEG